MGGDVVKITVGEDQPSIATVSINRPEQLNSITVDVLDGLIATAVDLSANSEIRAVILKGEGSFFSSGADFSLFAGALSEDDTNKARIIGRKGADACNAWENMPQVTIAAIEGGVVGGGLAIAMACDWRVMGADSYAYVPEVKVGVNFGWGSLPRLTTLVGPAKAKYMSIICEKHGASECNDWGLADFVSENGEATSKARSLAGKVSSFPRLPVQLIKRGVNTHAAALSKATAYADMEDLLLSLKDKEATKYRMETIREIKDKGE